jgi:hypothetical protein
VIALAILLMLAEPTPIPTASCTQSERAPRTLEVAEPETPLAAQETGVTGEVRILITLDASSNLLATKVQFSANPVLNASALRAARGSRFQTAIHNCIPVAASYIFIVSYQSQTFPTVQPSIDPTVFLPGTWHCVQYDTSLTVSPKNLGLGEFRMNADRTQIAFALAGREEAYRRDADNRWSRLADGNEQIQAGKAWDGIWEFSNPKDEHESTRFFARNSSSFIEIASNGTPSRGRTVRCTR